MSLVNQSLPVYEHVYLPGVSYATFDRLVTEVQRLRRLRIAYHRGKMHITSRLLEHERAKKLSGQMIDVITEELVMPRMSCGSLTFKHQLLDCGLEPDECYYIQHEADVRGRTVKFGVDPPPDLVIEADITTSVIDRFPIYATLGFPEIWQYKSSEVVIHLLQKNRQYTASRQSQALPMISTEKAAGAPRPLPTDRRNHLDPRLPPMDPPRYEVDSARL